MAFFARAVIKFRHPGDPTLHTNIATCWFGNREDADAYADHLSEIADVSIEERYSVPKGTEFKKEKIVHM